MSGLTPARADVRGGGALWFGLVSILCALVAAYTVVHLVRGAQRSVSVVVARTLVPPMTPVPASAMAAVDVPAAAVPAGALRSRAAVAGRLTRLGLAPGEVVTADSLSGGVPAGSAIDAQLARLAGTGACGRASPGASIPPRAVPPSRQAAGAGSPACADLLAAALPVSADQGFSLVNPGDIVNIAATYTSASGPASQIVCEDVPVLDTLAGAGAGAGGVGAAGSPALSGWLVLGLTPDQALRLQLVEASGKVAVLLRPAGAPAEPATDAQEVVVTGDLGGAPAQAPPAVAGVLP